MNRKLNRTQPRARNTDVTAATPEIQQLLPDPVQLIPGSQSASDATIDGELGNVRANPEDFGILLAACRIVASGYKTEISRGHNDSLFVQAGYQLLRHFLERQFAGNSRAA
jgi:hypothetical protein